MALTAGLWWHSRRRLIDSLSEQVELRAEQARLAERARISAEMHDVLAHRLSLLALHTGVLALRAESLPPQIGERIALLRTTSAQALDDLRDVLGALRAEDDAAREDGRDPVQRKVPAPALRNLSELLDEVRTIGQNVAADLTGNPVPHPRLTSSRCTGSFGKASPTPVNTHRARRCDCGCTTAHRPRRWSWSTRLPQ